MAHDLNFNKKYNEYSMFTAKEKAWHGLGQVVEGALTSSEAIKIAHLDYIVSKGKLLLQYPEHLREKFGEVKEHKGQFITFREDTGEPFGVVGSKYEVVQNVDAFQFFDDIVGFEEAIFETAGALNVGETVFITAKLPKHIVVGKNDVIDRYLLFTNCHDGSKSVEVMFTPIRVVCNNTLQFALRTAQNKFKLRHTKSVYDNMKLAKDVLGIENQLADKAVEIYKAMTLTRLTDRQALGFINSLFLSSNEIDSLNDGMKFEDVLSTRKKNILHDVQQYYVHGPGQDTDLCKGTLWGAYNAITGYFNNVKTYSNDSKRMDSLVDGAAYNTSAEAYSKAVSIVRDNSLLEQFN